MVFQLTKKIETILQDCILNSFLTAKISLFV